ncbi:Uncharacterised protein [Serratia entomophila]|nr:Uncharacterised protein [Serratia entomophila]CAI1791116.1 Uncharacterised protein [Serratia entomophila]CAI1829450.1 Uncharacterised protein [Serratia entomophila]CAI1844838.1 Uncharacterised protein [Serratia entomophila]CAI1914706.1 Uncharacterised protein [Serratia entomophila]
MLTFLPQPIYTLERRLVMSDIPKGTIVLFSGEEIPDGWFLCNGANGTPDLVDRFVLGGKLTDVRKFSNVAFSGDAENKSFAVESSLSAASIKGRTDGTALSVNQIPNHQHVGGMQFERSNWAQYGSIKGGTTTRPYFAGDTNYEYFLYNTSSVGGGAAHTHDLNLTTESHKHTSNIVAPYYILAYIMFMG